MKVKFVDIEARVVACGLGKELERILEFVGKEYERINRDLVEDEVEGFWNDRFSMPNMRVRRELFRRVDALHDRVEKLENEKG